MKEITLTGSTASKIRRAVEEGEIVLFTSDYGCVDCEEFEEELEREGLNWIIDYKVIVTHDDESIIEAFNMNVDSIPVIFYLNEKIDGSIDKLKERFNSLIEFRDELQRRFSEYAEKLSSKIGLKVKLNMDTLSIIAKSGWKKGKITCPCRIVETSCPCPYVEDELKKNSRCLCKLFIVEK